MRSLTIAILSTLILLWTHISILQGSGPQSGELTPLAIDISRRSAQPATIARPDASPVRSPDRERGEAQIQEGMTLEAGKPVKRELSGGDAHSYNVKINSGQYLRVAVERQGIDVAVALFTPDGTKIGEADGMNVTVGAESISAIAEATGRYRIEVRSVQKTARTGRYEIKIEKLREATAVDKYRVAAEALYREATLLSQGTVEEKRKGIEKYQEALELFRRSDDSGEESLSIKGAIGARKEEAATLGNLGAVHEKLGEMREALEKYSEALPIVRAIGDRKAEVANLSNLGYAYESLGEPRKALDYYNEALPIARAIGDRDVEAAILNNIGALYSALGEPRKALNHYDEALLIIRATGDRQEEVATLNNIGMVYNSLAEMRKSLEKYNEALPISRALGDRRGEAGNLNNIGMVYDLLGEVRKALEKYNEALPIIREIGAPSWEASVFNNIGAAYRALGEMPKALDMFNKALPIRRALGDRRGEAVTLTNIGATYRSLGETRKSVDTFNEALLIRRALGDRRGVAYILLNIGVNYQLLGEPRKALDNFNEGLSISRAVGDRSLEASAFYNIGVVYDALGETRKALDNFNASLSIRRAIGERLGEDQPLHRIAQVEQKHGNLTRARQFLEQAISIVESIRADTSNQWLRASFFASRQEIYQSYIDVLMQMKSQDPAATFDALALEVSERARARSLLELLVESRADIRQGLDDLLLERERYLQQLLHAKASAQFALLNRKHTAAQAEAAAKEIESLTNDYEELMAQIRERSPRYAALTQPQPLSLKEIQQQALDPDTLLLEYSLGDNASYLFVVSQTSITWRQLPKRAVIEEAARRVRELLIAPQPQPGDTEAKYRARVKDAGERYWPQAAELSRMLLGPVASQLGKKRLAIVADGVLQYIPFAALPTPSAGNDEKRNFDAEPQPLFIEHEIVSLPSASTLATLRRETAGRKPAEKSLAVLADPVFTDDDTRVKRNVGKARAREKNISADSNETNIVSSQMLRSGRETGVIGAEGGFWRLLYTRREAAAILAFVPERERMQALDFEASRTTALKPELGKYRIVHFATHGMLNNVHPELSGLVLSLVDPTGRRQDGFLQLQDIYNLKLSAELVVLSACQTGLGKEIKGEGLIGLTRGFMYAGAPRIVASLWKVDDRATSELMKRFYQGLLGPESLRPAAALRQAQLSIWEGKQWRAPYYWAAFVLQGEWK